MYNWAQMMLMLMAPSIVIFAEKQCDTAAADTDESSLWRVAHAHYEVRVCVCLFDVLTMLVVGRRIGR